MGKPSRILSSLPDDIIISILVELPVTSLLRFQSTCKSWCSFINDPNFSKLNVHKSSAHISRQKLLLVGYEPNEFLSTEASVSVDSNVTWHGPLPAGFIFKYHPYSQLHSCDGLIFMFEYYRRGMMLWNPSTRKYKLIPNPDTSLTKKFHEPILGFAYDSVAEDYKVLYMKVTYKNEMQMNPTVEIFSVNNQSWRKIDNFNIPVGFSYLITWQHAVSLNGTINFLVLTSCRGVDDLVVTFLFATEKFINTPIPRNRGISSGLHAFSNRLCLPETVSGEVLIWALEKDRENRLTWNKFMKFPTLGSLIQKPWDFEGFLFVKENGNILWRNDDGGRCIEYNVVNNEVGTEFKPEKIPSTLPISCSYVESLVSLKIPWD